LAWQAMAAIGLIVLGATLRFYGARGDLWLDEIWSMALLKPINLLGEIIWGINHDNNHVLNSIYLYVVGLNASPVSLRGLSIALGVVSVIAAGLIFLRNGFLAALIAMLLFAVSYPAVHFGSEARGYSGLILFSLLSLVFLQREFSLPSWVNRQSLGLAIGLGLLSHLSMVIPAATFGLWTMWVIWRRTADLRKALVNSFFIFIPALVWTIAVTVSVGFNALRYGTVISVQSVPNKFAIGGLNPFELAGFMNAYSELLGLTVGLQGRLPALACLAGAAVLIAAAAPLWRGRDDRRFSLYVIGVIIVPAVALAAQLPNSNIPRYFLFSGIMFLLFIADVINLAWFKGGLLRIAAAAMLLAFVGGNAMSLFHFFADGRGHYSQAVSAMVKNGRIVFGSDHDFRTPMVVGYFSQQLGVPANYVFVKDWCVAPPDWYVVEQPNNPILAHDVANLNLPACALQFTRADSYSYWGLSGRNWVLYRRTG